MKIVSHLPPSNLKAGKDARRDALLAANGRVVRYQGKVYRIMTVSLGGSLLANAQDISLKDAPLINLNDNAGVARDLKQLVVNRLFS